jgi:hypothetical protein
MREVWQTGPHCQPMRSEKLSPCGPVDEWAEELTRDPLQPRRRVLSPKERMHLRAALDRWGATNYVERSHAWIVHNPVFVEKKSGDIRTCIDYRPTNDATPGWEWPLPKIRDIRHRLQGARWFSRIDLKDAFSRIKIPAKYRPLTAFHTPWGPYQFLNMPQGLKTAPSTYQRFMDWHMMPHQVYVINYVDDILIFAKSLSQLRRRTAAVQRTLRAAAVEINTDKSEYDKSSIDFVGLRISYRGIGTALPIKDTPAPKTVQDWQSALGFANCFRDYLPLSDLTAGLYPGANQLPPAERQAKFKVLWTQLMSHVTLHHYDDNKDALLYLDASKYAIGAVLTQNGKVCAIFSKGLTHAQQSYSATDREHLALLHGVERFRVFIQSNQKLYTRTDHTALLNRKEDLMTARQLRWKLRITEITTRITHVAGKDNPADFWSRQGWKWGGDQDFSGIKE